MFAAKQGKYALCVLRDEDMESPREECDHVGKMVCFHSRHLLGDGHGYSGPADFLREAYSASISDSGKQLVRYLKERKAKSACLEYNRATREWELYEQFWTGWNGWTSARRTISAHKTKSEYKEAYG